MSMHEMYETIIPAHPGFVGVFIGDHPESDGHPTMCDPVIAWAVVSQRRPMNHQGETAVEWVTPITTSGPITSDGRRWVLRRPNGTYDIEQVGTFSTVEEAGAEVRKAAAEREQRFQAGRA